MKNVIQIFSLILIISLSAAAQEIDSIKVKLPSPIERIQINMEEFDFYRDLHKPAIFLPANDNPNTLRLWTEAALNYTERVNALLEDPSSITSPLYRQYIEDSKFNPFTYALGMAQAAAVGYLAYKHIKKYGFFK